MVRSTMRVALSLVVMVLALTCVDAFWRLPCSRPISIERADPIVTIGTLSGHAHTVMGASAFSATSTPESIRKSRCSTCLVKEDMSNYWIQTLFYQYPNGSMQSVEQNGGMLVYYLQRYNSNNKTIKAFPYGLRMVAGFPDKHYYDGSLAARAISYACLNYNGGGGPETHAFPQKNCPNGLRVQVFFPSCWDGVNLDSADHRSHMAYPSGMDNGDCPSTHPIRLVSIFFEVIYNTFDFADGWIDANGKPYRAMPFFWSTGDNTGYGHHGDFMNGWDVDVLQKAIDTCTYDSGVVTDCKLFSFWPNTVADNCKHEFLPASDEDLEGVFPALPGRTAITPSSFNPCGVSPTSGNDSTTYGSSVGTCTGTPVSTLAYTNPASSPDAHNNGETARVKSAPYPLMLEGYLGCYVDGNPTRTMDRQLSGGATYTPITCRAAAKAQGNYLYFGIQYGGECWVSNSTKWTSQGKSTLCVQQCNSAPDYYCGNGKINQVYSTYSLDTPSYDTHEDIGQNPTDRDNTIGDGDTSATITMATASVTSYATVIVAIILAMFA